MKIKYIESIKHNIDDIITKTKASNTNIEYIELNSYEYIQFLEEITTLERVLIINPSTKLREYRGIRIKVLT